MSKLTGRLFLVVWLLVCMEDNLGVDKSLMLLFKESYHQSMLNLDNLFQLVI